MNAIETEDLTKRFRRLRGYRDLALYPWRRPSHVAVDGVSLDVREGELFGLLGENGAGKTTLIRMLTTTLIPTAGTARVGGHDVVLEPQPVRRIVGVVSGDERSFYWRLTGRQNLEFFSALYRVPRGAARRRIDELVATLALEPWVDERFSTYSSGIKQRFAIARGLLSRPRVLFLDEPTRALDPIAADDVRRYVKERIQGELGTTVVLATHTLSEAESMCDRVAIIRHGRVVASGAVPELRANAGLTDVVELEIACAADTVEAALRRMDRTVDFGLEREGDRTRLAVRLDDGDDLVTEVLRVVVASGARVDAVRTRRPTLDDIYRAAHVD